MEGGGLLGGGRPVKKKVLFELLENSIRMRRDVRVYPLTLFEHICINVPLGDLIAFIPAVERTPRGGGPLFISLSLSLSPSEIVHRIRILVYTYTYRCHEYIHTSLTSPRKTLLAGHERGYVFGNIYIILISLFRFSIQYFFSGDDKLPTRDVYAHWAVKPLRSPEEKKCLSKDARPIFFHPRKYLRIIPYTGYSLCVC